MPGAAAHIVQKATKDLYTRSESLDTITSYVIEVNRHSTFNESSIDAHDFVTLPPIIITTYQN